jgi:hypothetical protein
LKLRGVANAGNTHPPNDESRDRMAFEKIASSPAEGKTHMAKTVCAGVLRAREREEVGQVGSRIADRARTVYVIGHG